MIGTKKREAMHISERSHDTSSTREPTEETETTV